MYRKRYSYMPGTWYEFLHSTTEDGGGRMIDKKLIVGALAVIVLVASMQGIRPVFADSDGLGRIGGYSTWQISVNSGHGKVCWSGPASGCTEGTTTLFLQSDMPLTFTFTATGTDGYHFVDWSTGSTLTMNPYTVTSQADPYRQTITANFALT